MSRLDRLVVLLETGSTAIIRNTAADQLLDLARGHPEEILGLVSRVYPFLQLPKWDTRIAAARALGGIVDCAEKWEPNDDAARYHPNDNHEVIFKSEGSSQSHTECSENPDTKIPLKIENTTESENLKLSLETDQSVPIKKESQADTSLIESEQDINVGNQLAVKSEPKLTDEFIIKQELDDNGGTIIKQELDHNDGSIIKQEINVSVKAEEGRSLHLEDAKSEEELHKFDLTIQSLISFDAFNLLQLLSSGVRFLANRPDDEPISDMLLEDSSLISKLKRHKPQTAVLENLPSPNSPSIVVETPATASGELPVSDKQMSSARLKAIQKRRAKANARSLSKKATVVDVTLSALARHMQDASHSSDSSRMPLPIPASPSSHQNSHSPQYDIGFSSITPGLVWLFQGVYELLISDLFDNRWEVRHGACLGIRELVRSHGEAIARTVRRSRPQNNHNNARALEDLAVRLCALLALDRFGDYVSDTVVAPVRESGAQTLAALLLHLRGNDEIVLRTFACLAELVLQKSLSKDSMPCWEAMHGGMLGVRYFVSVRPDILEKYPHVLDLVVAMVLHGLSENNDDDVQLVAALTLAPIASQFVTTLPQAIPEMLSVIWDSLVNLKDDLSASIGLVMDLLSRLCAHRQVIEFMQAAAVADSDRAFETLVPRLFPFLRHSITNVRKAVLRTIIEFLRIPDPSTKGWVTPTALRLVWQNLLVEQNRDVLELSQQVYDELLSQAVPSIEQFMEPQWPAMLNLVMTPIGLPRHNYPLNATHILRPSGERVCASNSAPRGQKRKNNADASIVDDLKVNIDAPMYNGDVVLLGYETLILARVTAAKALGRALSYIPQDAALASVLPLMVGYLDSPHSTPRLLVAILIREWCISLRDTAHESPLAGAVDLLAKPVSALIADPDNNLPPFRELVPTLKLVRSQCLHLLDVFVSQGKLSASKLPLLAAVVQGENGAGPDAFEISTAQDLIGTTFDKFRNDLSTTYRMLCNQPLEDAKHRVQIAIEEALLQTSQRRVAILAASLGCILALNGIPAKLNPVIRSLMDSIKAEETAVLQQDLALAVADLITKLIEAKKLGAADKIVKNLCAFVCVDTLEVPEFRHNAQYRSEVLSLRKEEAPANAVDQVEHEKAIREARIKRHGALLTLEHVLRIFGNQVFVKVPKLLELMVGPLPLLKDSDCSSESLDDVQGQAIVDALGLIRALLPRLVPELSRKLVDDQLPALRNGLSLPYLVFRYSTSKCIATMCSVLPVPSFTFLVLEILPLLKEGKQAHERQGVIECIYHISLTMGTDILPYVVFLVVPVLGRMSDTDHDVRVLATSTFAAIIKLVPLEAGIADPEGMPPQLLEGRDRERQFIEQMMDPSKIQPFEVPVAIKATLRKYQREGVNWLAFLNKYHLHGILCDDMGLGKTLQTICIIASDHYIRAELFKETGLAEFRPLPTLIICPPSLTGHWEQEINQYAPFLRVLVYAGGPAVRRPLRHQIGASTCDIVVTSYDVARNDVDILVEHDYNYCVLDEGHIIKNAQSKSTCAVKRIRAEHRLILSGTPIQNNVLELWSLFDFLMPGFLGTEKTFQERFAKPIAASRNSKTLTREQELGALALELLHKQVLPFMLRRLKEEVLADLPPKIIQDYYCEMSELQELLYKDCARQQHPNVAQELQQGEPDATRMHVFQALQYMRKLCNHPALVLSPSHPHMSSVKELLVRTNTSLKSIDHSPKLLSLRTLLWECGIGTNDSPEFKTSEGEPVIAQHRALVFCQLKDMLDIVELELLKKFMPLVTYMRLDGSTDPRDRQLIVRKFNEDPSIDLLLLTTKVGGLGLNLTGADTVIFVEHDWNPMNDLQAMDRAHRLGQKKVVNVYRLITKGTLEEKIMGLQKFKMNIALTIVNQQNAGLQSMDTSQLLHLFDVDENSVKPTEKEAESDKHAENVAADVGAGGLTGKAAGVVGEMGELWDESQYENEYNLDNFIKSLK